MPGRQTLKVDDLDELAVLALDRNRRCDGLVPAQRLEPGELRSYGPLRVIALPVNAQRPFSAAGIDPIGGVFR